MEKLSQLIIYLKESTPHSTMHIKAKKSIWQNFLIDEEALSDITRSLEIADRHIIEVWPGYGALTVYILGHHPQSLDMVELDLDMIKILDARFMGKEELPKIAWDENHLVKTTPIAIHHQDVLHFTPTYEEYSVIANIPYYITSPILFHFLYDLPHAPVDMVIMMQKEVGEKILEWRAKKMHHSFLSLAMENACDDIEIVRYVWKESFDPMPKVDSIVLKFSVKKVRNRAEEFELLELWKVAFAHPRKTLISNLKWFYNTDDIKWWLMENGYDEKVRGEAVKKEDWGSFMKFMGV